MGMDEVKELSKMGLMVGQDAVDEINDKTVDRIEELNDRGSTPMFVSEDTAEEINSNKGFAKALNNTRDEVSKSVDNSKQADEVIRDPISDDDLNFWRDNKDDVDMNEVDTKNDILF